MKLFFAEAGGSEILPKTVLSRIASPLGEDIQLIRRQVEELSEPFEQDLGAQVIWRILAKFTILNHHERLLQAAKNGGVDYEQLARNAQELDRLRSCLSGAHFGGERSSPRPLFDLVPRPDEPGDRLPTYLHTRLDEALGGGLRRKEVGLLVAPSNHGKTANLLRMATMSAQKGLKVFYMSFEIYLEQIRERVEKLAKKIPKTLIAEEYDADSLTANQVVQIAEKVKPDLLLIDYLDLLRFDALDLVQAQGLALRTLRNFCRRNEAVVWTAAQADEPYDEQIYLQRSQLYGSRQKIHATDVAIGLLYLPRRQVETFTFWKTRHARMGMQFSQQADFVSLKFKEINV